MTVLSSLAPVQADTEQVESTHVAEADTAAPRSPVRLLHVEDNSADALLIQEYIRGVIVDVEFESAVRLSDVTSESAAEATCAILDLSLPDASGLEALHALRSMSETLPIIVLTGFDDMELGLSAIRDGAEDYLIKNHIDGFTLERSIRYAIERRRLTLEVRHQAAAATVAEATTIVAAAALASADIYAHHPRPFEGTHQVAVAIDAETVDYSLTCQSCSWVGDRGSDDLVSWSERSLDKVLLSHVYYGNEPIPSAAITSDNHNVSGSQTDDAPPVNGSHAAAAHTPVFREGLDADEHEDETVSRRHLFVPSEYFRAS